MRRILSAADAKNRLADALRQAESSDLVLITRYRKPVAALVGGERLARQAQQRGTYYLTDFGAYSCSSLP